VLAGWRGRLGARLAGRDVVTGVVLSLGVMAVVVFGSRLAFPWFVPLGTALTVGVALLVATIRRDEPSPKSA